MAPNNIRIRTGVGAHFSASHPDLDTGQMHGHTWEVTAWFESLPQDTSPPNSLELQKRLVSLINEDLDHKVLPEALAWAESIATHLLSKLGERCVRVDICRNVDKLFARAERIL